jgi:hypothetical protein
VHEEPNDNTKMITWNAVNDVRSPARGR